MPVQGLMIVASQPLKGGGDEFVAQNAETGEQLEPPFHTAAPGQTEAALAAAQAAAVPFGDSAPADRARLLDAMAEAILATGDGLIERAMAETGLPRARLEGEPMRTVNQLRLFAGVLREGDFARVRADHADPQRATGPKPDLRLSMLAIGPVAVFGASNFPLAFSVAGGDTASALAAGCPVIVKGHPAHPGTSEIVAVAIAEAVRQSGFHGGIFSLLQDHGIEVGMQLVSDPRIKAVGFTGSRRAGEALMSAAAARAEPIPVFAEMSAVNPILLLPSRLEAAATDIAASFVASLTLGCGQFCTNPGLVLAVESAGLDRFVDAAAQHIAQWGPGIMLHPGICSAYHDATEGLARHPGVMLAATGPALPRRAAGRIFLTSSDALRSSADLGREMFGPAALIVRCRDMDDMRDVLLSLEGQLTIAIHFDEGDHAEVTRLLPIATRKAGRVLANGFGTGVEVSPAMVHGGPYPASSDSRSTSVGTMAIERFLRPVCLQDFPDRLLPEAVRTANPWSLPQRHWN